MGMTPGKVISGERSWVLSWQGHMWRKIMGMTPGKVMPGVI